MTHTDSIEPKMVIVVRTKYPDGRGGETGIRKGKLMAQAAHAGSSWLASLVRESIKTGKPPELKNNFEKKWIFERFKKVCLGVKTEEELKEIYNKAKNNKLNVVEIIDAGLTEFSGEPTLTCIGIGPDNPNKIDEITGHLPLL